MKNDVIFLIFIYFNITKTKYFWLNTFTNKKIFALKRYLTYEARLIPSIIDIELQGFNYNKEKFLEEQVLLKEIYLASILDLQVKDIQKIKSATKIETFFKKINYFDIKPELFRMFTRNPKDPFKYSYSAIEIKTYVGKYKL